MNSRLDMKQMIADSVYDLLQNNSLESIRVDQIADRCHISRRTFYYYFKDKFDVVNYIYHMQLMDLNSRLGKNYSFLDATRDFYRIVLENKGFYTRALNYEGQNSLLEYIFEQSVKENLRIIRKIHADKVITREHEYLLHAYYYGNVHMRKAWIRNGFDLHVNEMIELDYQCMPVKVRDLLCWNYKSMGEKPMRVTQV